MTYRTAFLIFVIFTATSGCSLFKFFEDGEPAGECETDFDCDNGVFCDGQERCTYGSFGTVCADAEEPECGRFGAFESCREAAAMCVPCEDAPGDPFCPVADAGVDAGPPLCGDTFCEPSETCVASRCEIACTVGRDRSHLGRDARGEGCDPGHACFWAGDAGSPFVGYCAPGNYNDVLVPNLGEVCGEDAACFSPFGRGQCDEGVCVVDDCIGLAEIAPGVVLTAPLCPSPAVCGDDQVCRAACATADDCDAGDACGGSPRQCRATCEEDADCRPTERCVDAEDVACPEGAACACEPLPS